MNELALFAGAGGGILGGKLLGWCTVCAVERDPYCRAVLFARQQDGILPPFAIWDDITTFDGRPWRWTVDVITAGFPCQPWSVTGQHDGADDARNLWPDTIRVVCEVRPPYVLLENVPSLVADRYFGTILGDLAEAGYNARWCVLGADDVGGPHQRKRLWIYGTDAKSIEDCGVHAHEGGITHQRLSFEAGGVGLAERREANPWRIISRPSGVAHGMADRVDRLAATGNGQVPLVAASAWRQLRALS